MLQKLLKVILAFSNFLYFRPLETPANLLNRHPLHGASGGMLSQAKGRPRLRRGLPG